jgi:hypothetical protein
MAFAYPPGAKPGIINPYAVPGAASQQAARPASRGLEGAESTQKVTIPSAAAGSVIGKQGSIIADLRSKTRCVITVAPATEENPNERVATVAGPAAGVDMAVSLIRQIIDKFNAMGGAASAGGGPRSRIPQNPQMGMLPALTYDPYAVANQYGAQFIDPASQFQAQQAFAAQQQQSPYPQYSMQPQGPYSY